MSKCHSLAQFQQFKQRVQLLYAITKGRYLARRWVKRDKSVALYYLPDGGRGFFVEVGLGETQESVEVLRSFSDSEALLDYAMRVQLPH